MGPRRFFASLARLVSLGTLLALCLVSAEARADRTDDLIRQLRSDRDYKVRLSAALSLGRMKARRAVPALTGALGDSNKTVRGVAAAALAKTVDSRVSLAERKQAIERLGTVARRDGDSFVRGQAKKAYDKLAPLLREAPPRAGVYIDVGPMSDNTGSDVKQALHDTVRTGLDGAGHDFVTRWPSGRSPSAKELRSAGTQKAFYIDGSVKSLDVRRQSSRATVSCSVSLFVATYPDKSMFGFSDGSAQVETSVREIDDAKRDCVTAVADSLVTSKLVPLILVKSR